MILAFKLTFRELFRFLRDKNQRKFWYLSMKFGNKKRHKIYTAKFNGFKINVVDAESFVWQFKEIFTDELYRFTTTIKEPIIYDCGANIGVSVLYFAQNYSQSKITAFEAHPMVANLLEENLKNNQIANVELHKKAVWTNEDGIEISDEGADGSSIFGEENKIKISSVRLANFLEKEDRIDMFKMDIEGAELNVLQDCSPYLHKIENLFVEFHSFKNREQDLSALLKILEQNGFRYDIYSLKRLKKSPLLNIGHETGDMDLQMNIFARRI